MLGLHWASLGAWLVENPPVMQETGLDRWAGKVPWRERLPALSSLLQAGAPARGLSRLRLRSPRSADPGAQASVQQQALRCGLSSRPRRVESSRSTVRPVSLAVAGGFLSTASPRKSLATYISIGI